MQHSSGTSAKLYASHSFFLSPFCVLLQLVCFCLFIQVFILAGAFSVLSLPSKSSNLQNLLLSPNKGSYVLLCVILVSPVLLMFLQPADRPASAFPPRPSTPPPACNNVSKCSSAWRWMGTILNTTCHLSNPRLVTGGEETKLQPQMLVMWRKAWMPAGHPKQSFCGSVSHAVMETVHLVCLQHCVYVFDDVPDRRLFCRKLSLKTVLQLCCIF